MYFCYYLLCICIMWCARARTFMHEGAKLTILKINGASDVGSCQQRWNNDTNNWWPWQSTLHCEQQHYSVLSPLQSNDWTLTMNHSFELFKTTCVFEWLPALFPISSFIGKTSDLAYIFALKMQFHSKFSFFFVPYDGKLSINERIRKGTRVT